MLPLNSAFIQLSLALNRQPVDAPPSSTPAMRLILPNGFDFTCRFEAIESRIKGPFLEPKQAAARFFQAAQDLKTVRLTSLQSREHH